MPSIIKPNIEHKFFNPYRVGVLLCSSTPHLVIKLNELEIAFVVKGKHMSNIFYEGYVNQYLDLIVLRPT